MALPVRPYHPQRFIHQKLHANRTKLFQASSLRSPPDQISRWSSAWLFPSGLQCEAPDQTSGWGSAWLFPSGHIPRTASSIKSFTQIRQKCSSIFNAKPTGPDHPLRFSMALPLRPSQPRRFIHQKLHANQTKMFKHLRCEAHQTRSAVEVQHGSSPDAVSPAALHPSKASPKSDKNAQASSTRSPPDYRSPVGVQHGSSPQAFNAKPTGPDQPLGFSMALHSSPKAISRLFPSGHITRRASCIFNAKPSGPAPPLTFSTVHLIPKPFLPSPTICPSGGIEAPTVTKLPPGTWPEKSPSMVSRFPTYIIKLKIDLQTGNCHSYSPKPPNTHYVCKQQLSLACRLAFVIFQQVFHSDSGPAMVLINNLWPHDIMFSPLKCPKLT